MYLNKFAEEHGLGCEFLSQWFIGQKVFKFFFEHRGATGLKHHNGIASLNVAFEAAQDSLQVHLCFVQHAEVIQRTSAAEVLSWNVDAPA